MKKIILMTAVLFVGITKNTQAQNVISPEKVKTLFTALKKDQVLSETKELSHYKSTIFGWRPVLVPTFSVSDCHRISLSPVVGAKITDDKSKEAIVLFEYDKNGELFKIYTINWMGNICASLNCGDQKQQNQNYQQLVASVIQRIQIL